MAAMVHIEHRSPEPDRVRRRVSKPKRRRYRLLMAGTGLVSALVSGNAARAADWRVTPALTFQELVTDNVDQTQSNARADALSQLIPSITITGDSPRGQVAFSYAPIISVDLIQDGQDRIDQNLFGNGSVNLIDRLLSVDFSVFVDQGSASGDFGSPGSNGLVPLSDRTLNYGGTFAPHIQQRFGDIATFDAYYRVSSSNVSGNDQENGFGDVTNDQLEQDAQIIVGSGNSFGRLSSQLDLDHSSGSGTGLNTQFENDLDIVKFEYHITHKYAVTGYAGYQKIHYDRTQDSLGYNNEGITWNVGIDATPNDYTTIQLGYGRQSGTYGLNAHIKYDLTPRTHIGADYTVTVENQLQANLQSLQFLGRDAVGNPIDIRSGLAFNNNDNQLFGEQNALFRDKIATVSFTRDFTRSSVTISAGNERRDTLSGIQSSDNAYYGQVTYSRELTPSLSGYADINYTTHNYNNLIQAGSQHDSNINGDVSLSYRINPKLTASATYSLLQRNSNVDGFSSTTNQFTIGIRKEF
jgi:uncharacterized protein (PEP-CTERM system associated)